jgi:DNA-binding CsgD family transcriptional regulator
MVSPVFIGRVSEMNVLQDVLDGIVIADPAVVVVCGEAGVGKSRFVSETLRTRTPSAARVLFGECSGFAPGSLPYEPIVRSLRQLLSSAPAVATELLSGHEAVVRLLPELQPAGELPNLEATSSVDGQARLFAELATVFWQLAADAPLILVLEDLHWADRSSLQFVAYLCHELRGKRIAILGTYRDDEASATTVLGSWLADRRRDPRLVEIPLHRFSVTELAGQVAGIRGYPADHDLISALHERSGGNPYFTELLLGDAAGGSPREEGSGSLSERLQQVLLTRVGDVDAVTRALLGAVAARGHAVSHESLGLFGQEAGWDEDTLLTAVREAVDRFLLIPVTAAGRDGYGFRHALLGEVIYQTLLPGERAKLHAVWATVLEQRLNQGRVDAAAFAEVAVHYHRAGQHTVAAGWDVRAAAAAETVGGFAEAAHSYVRLLDWWPEIPAPEQATGLDKVEILTRLAQAEELAGDVTAVHSRIEQAITLVDPVNDPLRAAMLHDQHCWSLYIVGRPSAALESAGAAVRLVPASPPSLARVIVLAGLGRLSFLMGDGRKANAAAHAAAAAAAEIHDPVGDALVAELEARVAFLARDADAVPLARRALLIAQQTQAPALAGIAFDGLAEALDADGNDRGVLEVCFGGYEQTRVRGGLNYGAWLLCRATRNLIARGRVTDAEAALHTALQVPPSGILDVYGQLAVAELAILRGDFDDGRTAITRCRLGAPEPKPPFARLYCAAAAELELWAGNPDLGFAYAAEGLASVDGSDYEWFAGELPWLVMRAAADRAEQARARRSPQAVAAAQADAQQLQALCERCVDVRPARHRSTDRNLIAAIAAEQSRLAGESDSTLWAHATRHWQERHRPRRIGYASWRHAEALIRHHAPRPTVTTCLREAHQAASTAAAIPLQGEITDLARLAKIDLTTAHTQPPAAPIPQALKGLTARELQVLKLLVDGRTNRELAEQLFISPRTAAVHVSNLLHKLGVNDRIQAAQLARNLNAPRT